MPTYSANEIRTFFDQLQEKVQLKATSNFYLDFFSIQTLSRVLVVKLLKILAFFADNASKL